MTAAGPQSGPRPQPLRPLLAALLVLAIEGALLALALGGLRALAGEPRALALLAISALGAATLARVRPSRGQQVTRAERDPAVMLALLALPLATPPVAALGLRLGLAALPGARALGWAGVALAAAGVALRIAAMRQLGTRFSPLVALQRQHALETRGLYARVRHPGYLGSLLATLGSALAFGGALALPLVVLMLAAQAARIRREEALLAERFGGEWTAYAARTGALLPRLGR